MTLEILFIFCAALAIRLVSLFRSKRNEKLLQKEGAIEYGKTNSLLLTLAHTLFYLSAITEAMLSGAKINSYTYIGIIIFVFSMVVLWMVIKSLGRVWTVKLYIAPGHILNESFIFKYFRHPNYFLNIIPELIGISLICQSWYTLLAGLPVYLVPLFVRISQEEAAMKSVFQNYGGGAKIRS